MSVINLTPVFKNKKYKGLWVAMDKPLKKVINADKDIEKAYNGAIKKGYKRPVLFMVPRKNLPFAGFHF